MYREEGNKEEKDEGGDPLHGHCTHSGVLFHTLLTQYYIKYYLNVDKLNRLKFEVPQQAK